MESLSVDNHLVVGEGDAASPQQESKQDAEAIGDPSLCFGKKRNLEFSIET